MRSTLSDFKNATTNNNTKNMATITTTITNVPEDAHKTYAEPHKAK